MRSKVSTLLTVIGAVTVLVLASNTVALATTGHSFILGKANSANKITSLTRTTAGPALKVVTKSSANPPLTVNGKGKVANLNADLLDGLSSSAFAPYPKVIRGMWDIGAIATATSQSMTGSISFGWTLPSAPTAHLIDIGDPLPAGCLGSATSPDAAPGNLCVWVTHQSGAVGSHGLCNSNNVCLPSAERIGAIPYLISNGAGVAQLSGTWAVRAASVSASRLAPSARTGSSSRVATGR